MAVRKMGLICGGPSLERGISLNSARSVLDHLSDLDVQIFALYVDRNKQFYHISHAQLYSNTPVDFDFKIASLAKKLSTAEVIQLLKKMDLVFSVIHGDFGEDGQLQNMLEVHGVPYVGSNSSVCTDMFYKNVALSKLASFRYPTVPFLVLENVGEPEIDDFFKKHEIKTGIVKPVAAGSSIGVGIVRNAEDVMRKIHEMDEHGKFMLQPFCNGVEFTIIVVQSLETGEPVPLIPAEIELSGGPDTIFDYRRKYLPTNSTRWHCPPNRISDALVQEIRRQAADVFRKFGMRDFARLDGWVLDGTNPNENLPKITFSDFNPISGLEQNSFLFQQAARIGLTHPDALKHILGLAAKRNGMLPFSVKNSEKKPLTVFVVFGGDTSERQISLMSGSNVWLKLRNTYDVRPCLLDFEQNIWYLPYHYMLSHTVEEIFQNCKSANAYQTRLQQLANTVRSELGLLDTTLELPKRVTLPQFLKDAKDAFVFIALHGGFGENGELQRILEEAKIPFNGSDSTVSALCIDKFKTGTYVNSLADVGPISSLPKEKLSLSIDPTNLASIYDKFCEDWKKAIVKPRNDGSSYGILVLDDSNQLVAFFNEMKKKDFIDGFEGVETPQNCSDFILEPYIEADELIIGRNGLKILDLTGWVELTVTVTERGDMYHALNPSITVAEGAILSVEEKFQGGTGINLTPPPEQIITKEQCQNLKQKVESLAQKIGIRNYARIDVFYHRFEQKIVVIEVNTLPGLTASTVLFQQALVENPPIRPNEFLVQIVESAVEDRSPNLD